MLSLLTSFGIAYPIDSFDGNSVLGQTMIRDDELLKINVQVTNNGATNEIGSIHIIADETRISKDSNDNSFAAEQTVIQLFEFSLEEIPVGTSFSVEGVYGYDYSKMIHGVNTQTNEPEIIDIIIP